MAINFKAKLAGLEKSWEKAKVRAQEPGDFQDLPDGMYIAQLVTAEVTESQKGNMQIHWEYSVLEGEQQGQSIHAYSSLANEDRLVWAYRDCTKLGYDMTGVKISQLEAVCAELSKRKPTVRMQLVTKPGKEEGTEFQNKNIRRLIESGTGEDAGAGEAVAEGAEAVAEGAEPETAEVALDVGTKVSFTYKGVEYEEEIKDTDEKKGFKVQAGKVYVWLKEDALTIVEESAEGTEEPVEEPVTATAGKGGKGGKAGKTAAAAEPEPEPETVELEVGMKVAFKYKGKQVSGPIQKLDSEKGQVVAKVGKELVRVPVAALTLVKEGKA
jgi:hypothetical protein